MLAPASVSGPSTGLTDPHVTVARVRRNKSPLQVQTKRRCMHRCKCNHWLQRPRGQALCMRRPLSHPRLGAGAAAAWRAPTTIARPIVKCGGMHITHTQSRTCRVDPNSPVSQNSEQQRDLSKHTPQSTSTIDKSVESHKVSMPPSTTREAFSQLQRMWAECVCNSRETLL